MRSLRGGWVLLAISACQAQQCNVTGLKHHIPCWPPRCRHAWKYWRGDVRNVSERGLHYRREIIDKFFEEWTDYQGFLGLQTAAFIHLVSSIQSDLGVFGSIGEIGVAAGKSFVTLATARRAAEPLFVCDLFAGAGSPMAKTDVEVELDNAALSNKQMFLDTLAFASISSHDVVIHDGPSFELSDKLLVNYGVAPFRLFHIDGGHFLEATLHDLRVAACTLGEGGVIMLDDLFSGIFPGVQEAFHRFMLLDRPQLRPQLVPFLLVGRLYLADRPFAEKYRELLRQQMPPGATWRTPKFMYGEEVLLPANLGGLQSIIDSVLEGEEAFFPWPTRRGR